MLKKPLFALLFLVCSMAVAAQQPFKSSTYIGAHFDKTLNYVNFTPPVSQDILMNQSFGLIVRHVSEPHVGIQLEVNYGGRGWIENRDSVGKYERKLTYLDIPVTAVFVVGSKHLRMVFDIGPDVSILRGDKETISMAVNDYQPYYGKPLEYNWTFSLTAGLALEWHSKIGVFGIHGSYYFFLPNLFPLNSDTFYYEGSKLQSVNVGVSYLIKLF
jgi:hypothetical protein